MPEIISSKDIPVAAAVVTPSGKTLDLTTTTVALTGLADILAQLFPGLPPGVLTFVAGAVTLLGRLAIQYVTKKIVFVSPEQKKALERAAY